MDDFLSTPTQSTKDLAFDLVSTDENRRAKARQALEVVEITPSEIVAKAYTVLAKDLQPHERPIAAIEGRL